MKRSAVFVLLAILVGATALIAQPIQSKDHAEAETAALQSATAWLKLVDDGKYDASWQSTSKEFQDSVSQEKWSHMLQAVRAPLGAADSRQLKDSTYTMSLPGAPDGEYVVLHFDTSFASKKSSIETLVMVLQGDQWRAVGYFIK